jgi:hypothetical protein
MSSADVVMLLKKIWKITFEERGGQQLLGGYPEVRRLAPVPGGGFARPAVRIVQRTYRLFFRRFASLARRSAVRFFAAAIDAVFARAERSSGVIVSRLRFPP